jgi:hypothetical protein
MIEEAPPENLTGLQDLSGLVLLPRQALSPDGRFVVKDVWQNVRYLVRLSLGSENGLVVSVWIQVHMARID